MTRHEVLEKVLKSFRTYYNINTSNPVPGFAAEALFEHHDEQYFLVKRAKLSESDAREFVYFATPERLTSSLLEELDRKAWEDGMAKTDPKPNHRSSDVTLIVIADRVDPEAIASAKKLKHGKSYMMGLRGYSNYRLVVHDLSSGLSAANRLGNELKKTIDNTSGSPDKN